MFCGAKFKRKYCCGEKSWKVRVEGRACPGVCSTSVASRRRATLPAQLGRDRRRAVSKPRDVTTPSVRFRQPLTRLANIACVTCCAKLFKNYSIASFKILDCVKEVFRKVICVFFFRLSVRTPSKKFVLGINVKFLHMCEENFQKISSYFPLVFISFYFVLFYNFFLFSLILFRKIYNY